MEIPRRIEEIREEIPGVRTFRLDNSDGLLPLHKPGQHVKLGVETPDGVAWKGFSISSSPRSPGWMEVTIRRKPSGTVSRLMHEKKPGETVLVREPSGRFVFDPDLHTEPLIFIAAGIGITPIMCILRTATERRITLIYGCKTADDFLFTDELRAASVARPSFRLIVRLSRSEGRIDRELLDRVIENPAAGRCFVSGPGDFNEIIAAWLNDRGVPADRIHAEVFGKKR